VFDNLKAGAGFVLGYQGFYAVQRFYRRSLSLPRLRESLVPTLRSDFSDAGSARRAETLELR
jgi:hypothetical protein